MYLNYKLQVTQIFAECDTGVECPDGEVHLAVDAPEIGKLDPECLVHGREFNVGIGRDIVLVQGPAGLVQPDVALRPPHGMVGPVHGNVCKREERKKSN